MRKLAVFVVLAALVAVAMQLAGCSAGGYAGFGSPRATLQTYLESARKADYATTYDAYYQRYHQLVTRGDFVSHRAQGSQLVSYRIDSLTQKGTTAAAAVTLTFAPKGGQSARTTTVREDLVQEPAGWRIKVW